jgi:predicted nuclease of predicted toxin-antitoxin system
LKLLLDEMWPAAVAEELRLAGHDVVAVVERSALMASPDATIFRVAIEEERALVTEDPDYRRIAETWYERGQGHSGLVFTTNRTFPRADPRTVGRLVSALAMLLESDENLKNSEHWLRRPG